MKTTQEMIAIMQAHVDGKVIEGYSAWNPKWIPIQDPAWNWVESDYRIKPESVTGWGIVWPHMVDLLLFKTEKDALEHTEGMYIIDPDTYHSPRIIRMVEADQ